MILSASSSITVKINLHRSNFVVIHSVFSGVITENQRITQHCGRIAYVQKKKEEKLRREQREYEEKLRREEREYELEKLRIQAEKNANTMNNPENVQAPKVIHETFHKFNMKDDISLNLTLFERHAELTFLPKKDWVQKLIGLIPIDIAHLIAREPADKCNDYNHVKGYC
ncbi:retrovirus-related Pol polyprotein from transposon 17.6 [Trichonephila clavipes]|nr:retrovirus-related Pol polyprotein from transposon 17.6 [Trichonephila clavipes]